MTDREHIALFDMDGTLFDYEGRLRERLLQIHSPQEDPLPEDVWVAEEKYPHIKKRMDLIKSVPGFWRNLDKFQLGWDVLAIAIELGFVNRILTKGPFTKSLAWMEKHECCRHHFGDSMLIHMTEDEKGGQYGRVLVDDYPVYVRAWLEHRKNGLAIVPAHRYNEDLEHPNVIRYDGTNLAQVRAAMTAAKKRPSKEHWSKYL